MKPDLTLLRALALDYRPTADYFVCLDRTLRMPISSLNTELLALRSRLDGLNEGAKPDQSRSLSEPDEAATITARIAEAETELVAAMEAARPMSVAILFGALPVTDEGRRDDEEWSYEGLLAELADDDGKVDMNAFSDRLLTACYLRTESADGEDMGLTWPEASRLCDSADRANLRNIIVGHHRIGAAIPFDPRTSGPSATT